MGAPDFANLPHIGAAIRRKEDYRFLTGAGNYTDDIVQANQAFAVFVRSPHAHANVKSIDLATIQKLMGHTALSTTSRYLHLRQTLATTASPLDLLSVPSAQEKPPTPTVPILTAPTPTVPAPTLSSAQRQRLRLQQRRFPRKPLVAQSINPR